MFGGIGGSSLQIEFAKVLNARRQSRLAFAEELRDFFAGALLVDETVESRLVISLKESPAVIRNDGEHTGDGVLAYFNVSVRVYDLPEDHIADDFVVDVPAAEEDVAIGIRRRLYGRFEAHVAGLHGGDFWKRGGRPRTVVVRGRKAEW